jgi:hypothetical protein
VLNLSIFSDHSVPHVAFGWFNLAWPNIAFWIAVIVLFAIFTWARIPLFMEADAPSRQKGTEQ